MTGEVLLGIVSRSVDKAVSTASVSHMKCWLAL